VNDSVKGLDGGCRVLLAMVGLVTACSVSPSEMEEYQEPASVGFELGLGSEIANDDRWSGVVAVSLPVGGICTGTFIHPRAIVTAAHCVAAASGVAEPEDVRVYGGPDVYDSDVREPLPHVVRIVPHELWDGVLDTTLDVDLALLELSQAIPSAGVHELHGGPAVELGAPGLLVGYGRYTPDDAESAGARRKGLTSVVAREGEFLRLDNTPAALPGDSGGPFFVGSGDEWTLAGVVSFDAEGVLCSESCGWVLELTSFGEWIEDELSELDRAQDPGSCSVAVPLQPSHSGLWAALALGLAAVGAARRRTSRFV
jgi:hypothetical protein